MKQKQPSKRTYQTDLRIKGTTPRQVAASFFKNDAPRKVEKGKPTAKGRL